MFLAKLRTKNRQDWEIMEGRRTRCWQAGPGEHFRGGKHGMEGTKHQAGSGAWKMKGCSGGAGEAELSWDLHLLLQPPQSSQEARQARAAEEIRLLHLLMN